MVIICIPIALLASFVAWNTKYSVGTIFCIWIQDLICTSISEELLFRGVLLNAISKVTQRDWLALTGASIIYGFSYWQSNQHLEYQFYFFTYAFISGLLFGIAFLKSGKIFASVLAHSLLDTMLIVFIKFPDKIPLPLQFYDGIWD